MSGRRRLFDPGDWLGMKPQLDPAASPISLDHKPDPGEIKLRLGLGLFVITVAAVVIYFLGDGGTVTFVAGGFGFFGLINLIIGIVKTRFEKSMLITDTQVFVQTRSLLGRKRWDEFIANYRGVLMREDQIERGTVGNIRSLKSYHIVELVHDDAAKTLPLYVREEGSPPRDIQEAFARRFGLPALAPDSRGEVARPAEALDRPIAGHAEALDRPVARQTPAADPGPPPSGVVVEQAGDTIRITVGPSRLRGVLWGGLVWLFWLVLPLAVGGGVYQLDPVMGLAAGGMTALFALIVLGLGALMSGKRDKQRETLCLDRERIWIDRPAYKRPRSAELFFKLLGRLGEIEAVVDPAIAGLPRDAVEQVRVESYRSIHMRSADMSTAGGPARSSTRSLDRLVIEGDQGHFHSAGSQFNRRNLEWVRDYLTYRLAGGAG